MSKPQVSFVIAAYNAGGTLARTIESILAQQDLHDYEVIVIDDGSTDRTADVARSFAAHHEHVKLHGWMPNLGRGAARAGGVQAAAGKFIAFVDSDIVLPPHWLKTCLSYMDRYDAVSGIAVPDGDVSYIYDRFDLEPKVTPHSTTVTGSNGLYKRQVFEKVSFHTELRDGEDVAFNHQMQTNAFKTHTIHSLLVLHKEDKSFKASLRWLYQTGKGATRQLKQFRQVRLPDVTYLGFMGLLVLGALLAVLMRTSVPAAAPFLYVVMVSGMHVWQKFVFRPRWAHRFGGAVLVDALLLLCYFAGRTTGMARAKVPKHSLKKKVAVCFDFEGAWGMPFEAEYDLVKTTRALLDILETHRIPATFFSVGKLVEAHPKLVQEIAARGHFVELHGYEHDHLDRYTISDIGAFEEQVTRVTAQIQKLTGRAPRGFRSPYLLAPLFYSPQLYGIFEKLGYSWTSNRELRYSEELFRPDRVRLPFLWGKNGRLLQGLGLLLNVRMLLTEHIGSSQMLRVVANSRWLLRGAVPFKRGKLAEIPVYSPLDCDLLETPRPDVDTPQQTIEYAVQCYVGGVDRPGPYYTLNFHDWIIGSANRIEIFSRTLAALSARPDLVFCSSDELATVSDTKVQ